MKTCFSGRQVRSSLALILRGRLRRPPRATIRSQRLARYVLSAAEQSVRACRGALPLEPSCLTDAVSSMQDPLLTLHTHPRRAEASRPRRGTQYDQSDPQDHGIGPVPEHGTNTPWKTFLAAHSDRLAAADFFTVEVLTQTVLAAAGLPGTMMPYRQEESIPSLQAMFTEGCSTAPPARA